jgi:thioredoxin-dependent peroxiredoxin
MVEIGEKAPEFELVSDKGEMVSLADFEGQKVVVYFYPEANTTGCTAQACALRDAYPQIRNREGVVIGISPDEPDALAEFREDHDLPFTLLSDPDHKVADAYGAWGEKTKLGKTYEGIIRSHFVVDEEGRVVEAGHNVEPLSTADIALKLIEV